jgi:hypothetical protein
MLKNSLFNLVFAGCFLSFLTLNCYATDTPSSTMPEPRALYSSAERRPHIGIIAGQTDPEGATDSQGEFGVEYGYQVSIPMGIAFEIMNTDTSNLERTTALAKATYNFGGSTPLIRHSYVGAALGADFERSGTYVASGPLLGFDIPLRNRERHFVSLGANAKYLIFSRGGVDTASALNGVIKYWY